MGLEYLEIVLEIERSFSIKVPDEVAARAITVGDSYGYVLEVLKREDRLVESDGVPGDGRFTAEHVWEVLSRIVVETLGDVDPREVGLESRYIEDLNAG